MSKVDNKAKDTFDADDHIKQADGRAAATRGQGILGKETQHLLQSAKYSVIVKSYGYNTFLSYQYSTYKWPYSSIR